MLTAETRSQLYWNHARVIAEMADAYNVFLGHHSFIQRWLSSTEQVGTSITYFTNIVRHLDVYFQEDQLMHTKIGLPLVPVPTYLPSNYKLEQNDVHLIENRVYTETRDLEWEMMIIMEENRSNNTNHSTDNSFSRLKSFELNNMGFGLNRISPITFYMDAFQTSENRGTQSQAPTSTPRECGTQEIQHQGPQMNRTYPLNAVPRYNSQEPEHHSYDADTSARNAPPKNVTQGRCVPPQQAHPSNQIINSGSEGGSQDFANEMTIYNVVCSQARTGTAPHQDLASNTSQTQLTMGGTTGTQMSLPQRVMSTGGTQTSPPKWTFQDQGTQGSPEHNPPQPDDLDQPGAGSKEPKGKKGKKKGFKEGGPTSLAQALLQAPTQYLEWTLSQEI